MMFPDQIFDVFVSGNFIQGDFLLDNFIRGKDKDFQHIDFLLDLFCQFFDLFGIGIYDEGILMNTRNRRFRSSQAFDIDVPVSKYRCNLVE